MEGKIKEEFLSLTEKLNSNEEAALLYYLLGHIEGGEDERMMKIIIKRMKDLREREQQDRGQEV
ncbi:hypothetical protein [Jeotgalibacillus terrae]|uniref:Uncharacterized protein n=1 Tax=Jeotgalibacillus terrae TaxID=587735 RepID=A0ABW5ZJU8_9BACL|nr:hypothetical protein [Jeotgalibacillus terrae]MBM7577648.1 hypothetical protein [Jeotgalibacillus terrae]